MKIKISDLKQGPIRQEILPDGFIERVQTFKQKLTDVEHISLEETVSNFQRDKNPEKELILWERIATAYETFTLKHNISPDAKKEAFIVLLGTSMGDTAIWERIKHLSIAHAKEIINIYLNL